MPEPATIALIVGATAAVAGTGVSIASAAGAFDPAAPDIPGRNAERIERERTSRLRAAQESSGQRGTILSTSAEPKTAKPATLLGQTAKPAGG